MQVKLKKWVLVLVLLVFGFSIFSDASVNAAGATLSGAGQESFIYYVDATNGDDANDGLSQQSPWKSLEKVSSTTFQPGDKILLKSGEKWTGSLHPLGSGTAEKPIILDKYGEGSKPLIEGQGVPYVIGLYNQEHWRIGNIEVTNYTPVPGTEPRTGVEIIGEDYQAGDTDDIENVAVLHNIHLHDLYIHDVNGLHKKGVYGSAGINVLVRRNQEGLPHRVTKFDQVLIENNKVENVTRTGIMVNSAWTHREQQGGPVVDPTIPWTPATNVVIRGNEVLHVSGDGIVPHITTGALVEHNRVHGYNEAEKDYNAGMWTYNGDYTVYQFNEVSGGKTIKDGMSFDYDNGTKGLIFQYNYSHDNEGGTVLICQNEKNGSVSDGIFRYNISQNDHYQMITVCSGSNYSNMQFYNNVFYVGPGIKNNLLIDQNGNAPAGNGEAIFNNNIFYNLGTGGYTAKSTWKYDGNLFYGNNVPTKAAIPDANMLTANPVFINPGKAASINDLDGYQLKNYSPAINSGAVITNNGGTDFWGNPLYYQQPDRGAYEQQADKEAAPPTEPEDPPVSNDDLNNVALGKIATTSGSFLQNPALATDGLANDTNQYTGLDKGVQWMQLDLGGEYKVNRVKLWHYFSGGRTYNDVIVQLSNTPDFSSGVTTVFNNDTDNSAGQGAGTDQEYKETADGKEITFAPVEARYVRFWSNGSKTNAWNHMVEAKVYGTSLTPTNVALGKAPTSGSFVNDSERITDGLTNDSNQYAGLAKGLQWMQLDLGAVYNLSSVKLWHYFADARTYKDVIIQLSTTPDFSSHVTTVFNNDADNSAGQGIGADKEYKESADGKEITFTPVNARYVRFWSNGSIGNVWNHYVEAEVYGIAADFDRTPPVTLDDATEGWHRDEQIVNLSAADEGSGVAKTFYSLDDSSFVEGTSVRIMDDGVHTLKYYSVDHEGNMEDVKTAFVKIDRTAPKITPKGSLDVYQFETVTIDFGMVDEVSGITDYEVSLDGIPVQNPSELAPLTLQAGKHTIKITAADYAGNEATKEFALNILIDVAHLPDVLEAGKSQIHNQGIYDSLLAKVKQAAKKQGEPNVLVSLENELQAQSGKHIDSSFAQLLLDDINFLKN
ncbi:OmpL47-type beta-barrel domain-containing protein [Neobacillus sp. 19]|uniref:OmpL47-type beta-barrel domain-containing protein n=1 Tax=Neobacillus sp. 19 TaxID=3394458 RepID=UPI003BF6DC3F